MILRANQFILLLIVLELSTECYCSFRQHGHKSRQNHGHKHRTTTRNRKHQQNSSGRLLKRQAAVELIVNKLHILESLDGQLRQFAHLSQATTIGKNYDQSRASNFSSGLLLLATAPDLQQKPIPSRVQVGFTKDGSKKLIESQQVCLLPLKFDPNLATRNSSNELLGCLANQKLKRHIPPYMLNLHSQLMSECRTLADAVRLMPYKSLIMRSFKQPALFASAASQQGKLVKRKENKIQQKQLQTATREV